MAVPTVPRVIRPCGRCTTSANPAFASCEYATRDRIGGCDGHHGKVDYRQHLIRKVGSHKLDFLALGEGTLMGLRSFLLGMAVLLLAVQARADTADEVKRARQTIQTAFNKGD